MRGKPGLFGIRRPEVDYGNPIEAHLDSEQLEREMSRSNPMHHGSVEEQLRAKHLMNSNAPEGWWDNYWAGVSDLPDRLKRKLSIHDLREIGRMVDRMTFGEPGNHDAALADMAIEKLDELRQERDRWKEQAGHWEAEAKRLRELEAQP